MAWRGVARLGRHAAELNFELALTVGLSHFSHCSWIVSTEYFRSTEYAMYVSDPMILHMIVHLLHNILLSLVPVKTENIRVSS